MKQLCILLCTLAVIIGLNIFQSTYLSKSSEKLKQDIQEIKLSIQQDNFSQANNNISVLEKNWEENKCLWDILTEHDDVEEIEASIASLKAYSQTKIKSESLNECYLLTQRIEHILENETLDISNIF